MDPLGYLLEEPTDTGKLIEFLEKNIITETKTKPEETKPEETKIFKTKEEVHDSIIEKMESTESAEFIAGDFGNELECNSYDFRNIRPFGLNEILVKFLKRNPTVIPTKQSIEFSDSVVIREKPYNSQLYRSNLIINKNIKMFLPMLNRTGLSFVKYNNRTDSGILQNFDIVVVSPYQLQKYEELFMSKYWNRVIIMSREGTPINLKFVTRWYFIHDIREESMIYRISEIGTEHLFKPILMQKILRESPEKAFEKKIITGKYDKTDLGAIIAAKKSKYNLGFLQFKEKYIRTLKTNSDYVFDFDGDLSLPKFTNEKIENYIKNSIKQVLEKIAEDDIEYEKIRESFRTRLCENCGNECKEMYLYDFFYCENNRKNIICGVCFKQLPDKGKYSQIKTCNEWERRNTSIDYINLLLGEDLKIPDYIVSKFHIIKEHKRIVYPKEFSIKPEYDLPLKRKILMVAPYLAFQLEENGVLYFDINDIIKFAKSKSGILVLSKKSEAFNNMDLSFCTDLVTDVDISNLGHILRSLQTINRTFPLVIHHLS